MLEGGRPHAATSSIQSLWCVAAVCCCGVLLRGAVGCCCVLLRAGKIQIYDENQLKSSILPLRGIASRLENERAGGGIDPGTIAGRRSVP